MPRAAAIAGFRYLNIDLETGRGARTFNTDVERFGPFVATSLYF